MKPGPKPRARTTPNEKRCAKCEQVHPADQFWKAAKAHDGLQTWCKGCAAAYNAVLMRQRRKVAA